MPYSQRRKLPPIQHIVVGYACYVLIMAIGIALAITNAAPLSAGVLMLATVSAYFIVRRSYRQVLAERERIRELNWQTWLNLPYGPELPEQVDWEAFEAGDDTCGVEYSEVDEQTYNVDQAKGSIVKAYRTPSHSNPFVSRDDQSWGECIHPNHGWRLTIPASDMGPAMYACNGCGTPIAAVDILPNLFEEEQTCAHNRVERVPKFSGSRSSVHYTCADCGQGWTKSLS